MKLKKTGSTYSGCGNGSWNTGRLCFQQENGDIRAEQNTQAAETTAAKADDTAEAKGRSII